MSRTPKTLNTTEQQQLLDALQNKNAPPKSFRKGIRNHLMGCLMLEAGLRVGEVVSLKISHLFYDEKPVRTLVLTENITKNHKERIVPISTRLAQAIEEYFKHHFWIKRRATVFSVWCTELSINPLTTRQVEKIIRTAGMKALGRPVHPHMLRHTFATKLMRVTDMKTVQELLGHSDLGSTQIYCHPNEDDKRKAIQNLEPTPPA